MYIVYDKNYLIDYLLGKIFQYILFFEPKRHICWAKFLMKNDFPNNFCVAHLCYGNNIRNMKMVKKNSLS